MFQFEFIGQRAGKKWLGRITPKRTLNQITTKGRALIQQTQNHLFYLSALISCS